MIAMMKAVRIFMKCEPAATMPRLPWNPDAVRRQPGLAAVAELLPGPGAWITVTSGALVEAAVRLFGDRLRGWRIASISPVTSATLRRFGLEPAAEALLDRPARLRHRERRQPVLQVCEDGGELGPDHGEERLDHGREQDPRRSELRRASRQEACERHRLAHADRIDGA
jgi:hypothetical protein